MHLNSNFNPNVNENVLQTSGSRANSGFPRVSVQCTGEEKAAALFGSAACRTESAIRGDALDENPK